MTREISIVYGTYTVGTTSGSIGPDGKIRISNEYEVASVEFDFFVTGADAATFAANCVATEAAFRKPYQDLTVTISTETLISALQSGGTALDTKPEIVKQQDVGDTGRSRKYTVRIEYGMAAQTGAEPVVGLRESFVDVSLDPAGRASVTISGTFTATTTTAARAQYEAQIDGYATTILSGLSITNSELDPATSARTDINDRVCEFSRTYEELIFGQAGSSLDDASLIRQRLAIIRRQEGPGDTPQAERLATIDLSYEVWVDKDTSTDLDAKYASIREWLITQINTTLNGGQFALVVEAPRYHRDENRIEVNMTALGQPQGEAILENLVTVDDDDLDGEAIVPAWDGDDLSAYTYQGPRVVVRTVNHKQVRIGTFNEQDALRFLSTSFTSNTAGNRPPEGATGGRWVRVRRRPRATAKRLGIGNETMDVTDLELVSSARYVKEPRVTPASGGRRAVATEPP